MIFGFSNPSVGTTSNDAKSYFNRHNFGVFSFNYVGGGGGGGSINSTSSSGQSAEAGKSGDNRLSISTFPNSESFTFSTGSGGVGAEASTGFTGGSDGGRGSATFISGLLSAPGGEGGRGRQYGSGAESYNPTPVTAQYGIGGYGGNSGVATSWNRPDGQWGGNGYFLMTRLA